MDFLKSLCCFTLLGVTTLAQAGFSVDGHESAVHIQAPPLASPGQRPASVLVSEGRAWKEPIFQSKELSSLRHRSYVYGDFGLFSRVWTRHSQHVGNAPLHRFGVGYRFADWSIELNEARVGAWDYSALKNNPRSPWVCVVNPHTSTYQGASVVRSRAIFLDLRKSYGVWQPRWWLILEPYVVGGLGMGRSALSCAGGSLVLKTPGQHLAVDMGAGFLGRMTEHTVFDLGLQAVSWPHIPYTAKKTTYMSGMFYAGLRFVF